MISWLGHLLSKLLAKALSNVWSIIEVSDTPFAWGQPIECPMYVLKETQDDDSLTFVDLFLCPSELLTHLTLGL